MDGWMDGWMVGWMNGISCSVMKYHENVFEFLCYDLCMFILNNIRFYIAVVRF
jgi:hypothetical protein